MNLELARPEIYRRGLLGLALDRNKAHGRPLCSFTDRLGIGQGTVAPCAPGAEGRLDNHLDLRTDLRSAVT